MELDSRKLKVLSAAVEIYTETGEPVGSKAICDRLDFPVSSATIRKELSDLCEAGLMEQPHTSAGRIPTAAGYRLYLDKLINPQKLTKSEKASLDKCLPSEGDPLIMLKQAAESLAELTRCAVISTSLNSSNAYARRLELIPIGLRTAMLVLVTSAGVVKTKIVTGIAGLDLPLCSYFSRFAEENICGIPLASFSPAFIQTLGVSLGQHMFSLAPILSEAYVLIQEAGRIEVNLQGAANLLQYKEFEGARGREIIHLLSRKDELLKLFENHSGDVKAYVSSQEGHPLRESGVIIAKYSLSNDISGHLAVIGPARLNYRQIIPGIAYYSEMLGRLLEKSIEE